MKFVFSIIWLLLFINCGDQIKEVIVETYPDESPKKIHFTSGEGEEKIILKKISLKENGDTLKINFGDTLITNYDYYSTDTLKAIASYLDNQKFGEWKYFHDNGFIDCFISFN